MQIPSLKTWIDGETVTPQLLNENVRDPANLFLNRPTAIVAISTTTFSFPNATWTKISSWDTAEFDNDSMTPDALTDGGLRINSAGLYFITAGMSLDVTGGRRLLGVTDNGDWTGIRFRTETSPSGNYYWCGNVAGMLRLDAGDVIHMIGYQDSGASATTSAAGYGTNPRFSATWVGP